MSEKGKYISVSKLYDAIERILNEETREVEKVNIVEEDVIKDLNKALSYLRSAKNVLDNWSEKYESLAFIVIDIIDAIDGIDEFIKEYVESR